MVSKAHNGEYGVNVMRPIGPIRQKSKPFLRLSQTRAQDSVKDLVPCIWTVKVDGNGPETHKPFRPRSTHACFTGGSPELISPSVLHQLG